MGTAISKLMKRIEVSSQTFEASNKEIERSGYNLRDLELMASNNSTEFKKLAQSMGVTQAELKDNIETVKQFNKFAAVAGMSAEEFQKIYGKDQVLAMSKFIDGLKNVEKNGQNSVEILEEMGLTEVRLSNTILALSNAQGGLTGAVEMANKAWEENTALTREADLRYSTTESKIQMMKNSLTAFAIETYDSFRTPFVNALVEIKDLLDDFVKEIGENGKLKKNIQRLGKDVGKLAVEVVKSLIKILPSFMELIASTVELATKVLPTLLKIVTPVLKAFLELSKIMAKYSDVLIGLTVATVAYKGAIKALNAVNLIKNTYLKLSALLTGKLRTAELLGIATTKAATVATAGATVAQTGLNAAMAANPIGLVVAALTGLVYLLYKYATRTTEATKKTEKLKEKSDKLTDAVNDNVQSYEDLKKARDENMSTITAEMDKTQNLWDELQTIVDANGKIKAGYEARASFIINTINEALGAEMSIVDGQIVKYKELEAQIDKVIEKQRAQALISANQDRYDEAVIKKDTILENNAELESGIKEAKKNINSQKAEIARLSTEMAVNTAKGLFDEAGGAVAIAENAILGLKIANINKDIEKNTKIIEKNEKAIANANNQYFEYAGIIDEFEKNSELFETGKYNEISFDDWAYTRDTVNNAKERTAEYDKEMAVRKLNLEKAIEYYNKLNKEEQKRNKQQVLNSVQRLENLRDTAIKELATLSGTEREKQLILINSYTNQINETKWGNDTIRQILLEGYNTQLTDIIGKQVEFQDAGNGLVQAVIDGVKVGEPTAVTQMENLMVLINKEIVDGKPITEKSIKELLNLLSTTINNEDVVFEQDANGLMQAFVKGIKTGEPMTVTQMEQVMNAVNGAVVAGKPMTIESVQTMINGMAGVLKNDTTVETGANKVVEDITSSTSDLGSSGETSSKNWLLGILRGLLNKNILVQIIGAVKSVTNMIKGETDKGLENGSPSKAAERSLVYFLKGAIVGIDKEEGEVIKRVQSLGETITGTLQDTLGDIKTNVSAGLNINSDGSLGGVLGNGQSSNNKVVNWTQNITSPRPYSRLELYQQQKKTAGLISQELANSN